MSESLSRTSLFSTPIDSYLCKDEELFGSQKSYEFCEEDSHITDMVKTLCDTDNYCSEGESISTLDKSKALDSSSFLEERTSNAGNKFKLSNLFKGNLKEDIADFKKKLIINFQHSLNSTLKRERPFLKKKTANNPSSRKISDFILNVNF